ncbi:MAG: amidohydrolase family protein [Propionibacteriales bacterium]|nr:amidohydrolase family protein [Propionibacteriales bacterium]
MSVDIHAHTIPESFISALGAELPDLAPTIEQDAGSWHFRYPWGQRIGPVPPGMFDTGERLAAMDKQQVTMQALSVPPGHFLYDVEDHAQAAAAARLHNDAMIEMARAHPDRFVVLGTLPLQAPEAALAELDRLSGIEQVAGLEFGTNVSGTGFDHPSLAEVWESVNAAGMGVVLHPNNFEGAPERMHTYHLRNFVGNPTDTTLAAGTLLFGGVLVKNPSLRIALLHGGGFLPYQIGRFEHGWRVRPEAHAQLDVSPRHLLDRFFFDTLTHDAASLRFLIERVGPQRVCLGSDYPFDMADADPVRTIRAAIETDEMLESVLDVTPREFLTRRPRV